jgi:hypothetical protein
MSSSLLHKSTIQLDVTSRISSSRPRSPLGSHVNNIHSSPRNVSQNTQSNEETVLNFQTVGISKLCFIESFEVPLEMCRTCPAPPPKIRKSAIEIEEMRKRLEEEDDEEDYASQAEADQARRRREKKLKELEEKLKNDEDQKMKDDDDDDESEEEVVQKMPTLKEALEKADEIENKNEEEAEMLKKLKEVDQTPPPKSLQTLKSGLKVGDFFGLASKVMKSGVFSQGTLKSNSSAVIYYYYYYYFYYYLLCCF